MLSIPIIGIIIILVIILVYFSTIKNQTSTEINPPEVFVLFNGCYFIQPHVLIEVFEKLQTSTDDELFIELYVKISDDKEPNTSFEKYFSIYNYNCIIQESNNINKETKHFVLKFFKNEL